MDRNANYALVGVASSLLVVGLVAFSLWLAAFKVGGGYDSYDIVFEGPVSGLSEGGEVHFNGIKVGEVTEIKLDADDPSLVVARARVESDIPVRVDSRARLEPQGITGLNYVLITAGTPGEPLLNEAQPGVKVRRIPTERSKFSDLLDGGATVVVGLDDALARINLLLSEDNIARISNTLDDIQLVAAELRENRALISETKATLARANEAIEHINTLAINSNALVAEEGRRSMASLESAAASLDSVMGNLEAPANEFATNGLPQVLSAIASLQHAVDNLDRTLSEVRQSPQGLITRPPAREIEVQP
jgi:phospholipid/cholesterol/gamma-HCH transport system substrate-binding protein